MNQSRSNSIEVLYIRDDSFSLFERIPEESSGSPISPRLLTESVNVGSIMSDSGWSCSGTAADVGLVQNEPTQSKSSWALECICTVHEGTIA